MFSFSSAMLIPQRLEGTKHAARKTPLPFGKICSGMELKSKECVNNETVFCFFVLLRVFFPQPLKWNWQLEGREDQQQSNLQLDRREPPIVSKT